MGMSEEIDTMKNPTPYTLFIYGTKVDLKGITMQDILLASATVFGKSNEVKYRNLLMGDPAYKDATRIILEWSSPKGEFTRRKIWFREPGSTKWVVSFSL